MIDAGTIVTHLDEWQIREAIRTERDDIIHYLEAVFADTSDD
jgi:hypothetical protein